MSRACRLILQPIFVLLVLLGLTGCAATQEKFSVQQELGIIRHELVQLQASSDKEDARLEEAVQQLRTIGQQIDGLRLSQESLEQRLVDLEGEAASLRVSVETYQQAITSLVSAVAEVKQMMLALGDLVQEPQGTTAVTQPTAEGMEAPLPGEEVAVGTPLEDSEARKIGPEAAGGPGAEPVAAEAVGPTPPDTETQAAEVAAVAPSPPAGEVEIPPTRTAAVPEGQEEAPPPQEPASPEGVPPAVGEEEEQPVGLLEGPPEGESRAEAARELSNRIYQIAYNDYSSGNYQLALLGFREYLKRFPDSPFADDAQYWIGECQYAVKNYQFAIEEFETLVSSYPSSPLVPSALLKTGFAWIERSDPTKAAETLKKVIAGFPGTQEAALAQNRLNSLY